MPIIAVFFSLTPIYSYPAPQVAVFAQSGITQTCGLLLADCPMEGPVGVFQCTPCDPCKNQSRCESSGAIYKKPVQHRLKPQTQSGRNQEKVHDHGIAHCSPPYSSFGPQVLTGCECTCCVSVGKSPVAHPLLQFGGLERAYLSRLISIPLGGKKHYFTGAMSPCFWNTSRDISPEVSHVDVHK